MNRDAFGSPFTVGLEEELQLVDATSLALAPDSVRVLDALDAEPGAAGHEAFAAQIELRSPVSTSVAEGVVALAELRRGVLQTGATPLGVGLHPTASFGDAELVDEERYRRVAAEVRGLLARTPEAALHVHIGLPDEQAAVRAHNALRCALPVLHALAANSPWWFGVDSGLASARYAVVRAYPGRGIPPPLRDIDELEERTADALAASGLAEPTLLWGDLRIHPVLGTLEVRELDAQSRLEDVAAIAALARALAFEGALGDPGRQPSSESVSWSMFHASRDGVDAHLLDDGSRRPLAELADALVERVRGHARALGDEEALDGTRRIVESGGGAGRRRAAAARAGARGMLEALAAETSDT